MYLVVASPLSDLARDQREVREAMALGIPIALLLAAAGGLWLASIGLRPIDGDGAASGRDPADRRRTIWGRRCETTSSGS